MTQPLIEAVNSGDVARVGQLLAAGADVNARDAYGATALMNAASSGNMEMVEALLAAGAEVDAKDELGWTAMMKACFNADLNRGFPEIVTRLIAAGADPNVKITYGIRNHHYLAEIKMGSRFFVRIQLVHAGGFPL